ncbi:MAG: hypothetical protein Kow00106_06430 [Anaerolineae bacterium]
MDTNSTVILWVIGSALYGAVITPFVYRRRGRKARGGVLLGALAGGLGSFALMALFLAAFPAGEMPHPVLLSVAGLIGGLLLLVPLWLLTPRVGRQCPYCYSVVDANAIVCPQCGREFPGAPQVWDRSQPLLSVRGLVVEYKVRQGALCAIDGVDLDIYSGELLALVGESGCGKSTLAYGLIRHVTFPGEISSGKVLFQGQDVLAMTEEQLRQFRWRNIAVVFQAAQNALNPVMRVADQFIDTGLAHDMDDRAHIIRRAGELLQMVRLDPARVLHAYPFQLSGGMRQRVVIALSLLLDPKLLILDEPTTALDVVTQVHILDILQEIREKLGLTMLLLTHDMSIVARVADRVAVMYAGKIVEVGAVREVFYRPRHPYTAGLVRAAPSLVGALNGRSPIPGNPPNFLNMPSGCRFHPRCAYAVSKCRERAPALESVGADGAMVACHRWREITEELAHAPAD